MKSADGTLSATVQIAHACAVYTLRASDMLCTHCAGIRHAVCTLCGHQTCCVHTVRASDMLCTHCAGIRHAVCTLCGHQTCCVHTVWASDMLCTHCALCGHQTCCVHTVWASDMLCTHCTGIRCCVHTVRASDMQQRVHKPVYAWKFRNTNVSTLYFCACKCKRYSVQYMHVQGYVCRIGVLYAAEVKLQGIYSCMYAYHSVHREAQRRLLHGPLKSIH